MIAYTFRTYPYIDQLKEIFDEVFIFGVLRSDFKAFSERIVAEEPQIIIGIADTTRFSRIEPITVNRFNKGVIQTEGQQELGLHIPVALTGLMPLAKQPTTTFCNWTMYKLQSFIEDSNLNTRLSFLHVNHRDIESLRGLL